MPAARVRLIVRLPLSAAIVRHERDSTGTDRRKPALQNHIVKILNFVADDLESPQTPKEQFSKSQGEGPSAHPLHQNVAEIHAALRLESGFNVDQMISEYRGHGRRV